VEVSRCRGPFRHSNGKRLSVIVGILATCTACTDPKAVQTFAGMAPDPSLAQGLTRIYVAELGWRAQLNQGTNVKPDPNSQVLTTQRIDEAKGIVAIDTGIREYMKGLGALAADSVVQSSSNVNDLKTGLTAFEKARPDLGITNSDITLISEFVQAVADLAESGYRNAKLSQLIGNNQAALQRALDIQIEIVNRAIIPSINEYRLTIDSKQRFLSSQPAAVHYLFDRTLSADQDNAAVQLTAAQSYAKALGDIKTAHTALYNNRDNVLTKAMFDQIKGPAQEAYNAFEDYQKAVATSPAK
jgi:hypothetical protein